MSVEHVVNRMKLALVCILIGLVIQIVSLIHVSPTTFMLFLMVGVPLLLLSMLLLLANLRKIIKVRVSWRSNRS